MADPRYTVDELVGRLRTEIAAAGLAPLNGQVQAVPDRRTLRYYTTLGLLDRPVEMRGRQAMYGERHLLQALAIKRLQAEGFGLAAVQRQLAGLPDDDLRAVAFPASAPHAGSLDGAAPIRARMKPRTAFWAQGPSCTASAVATADAQAPAPPAPAVATADALAPADALVPPPPPADNAHGDQQPLAAVPLGDGVVVLLPSHRPLGHEDLVGLRAAAAPLLAHLRRTGALGPDGTATGA